MSRRRRQPRGAIREALAMIVLVVIALAFIESGGPQFMGQLVGHAMQFALPTPIPS